MQPPSSFKQIDTLRLARKIFGFTSNKLEYMTNKLCLKYKKLKVKKFPGFDLWSECLNGNLEAWKEMERYNKMDVLSLEELYKKLIPWETSINFNLYSRDNVTRCTCGSTAFLKNGFFYSAAGKFQRYYCGACGAEIRDKQNLFPQNKKRSLKVLTKK
jgi:DNA-directed RNA polymerase subunit RPC12/RpoP